MALHSLSDDDLILTLKTLVANEARSVANVIAGLVEVEHRRLHLGRACPSMFDFCVRTLGMSDGSAGRRVDAAKLAARFPRILDAIAEQRIHLSTLLELKPILSDPRLTVEAADELVDRVSGKSKRQVRELVASLAPRPDAPSEIRVVPEQASLASANGGDQRRFDAIRFDSIEPLAPARHRVQFTVDDELRDKIEHLTELLRHKNPSGDLAVLFGEAVDVLIAKVEKTRLGKTTDRKLPAPRGSKDPGYIDRSTRREVALRDGGRCTFRAPNGDRCPARGNLEFDHTRPRGKRGRGDAGNVRVLCRAHNHYAAVQEYGEAHVARSIETSQAKAAARRSAAPSESAPIRKSAPATAHRPSAESETSPESVKRARIRFALVHMGFRAPEVGRTLAAFDGSAWARSEPDLIKQALAALV